MRCGKILLSQTGHRRQYLGRMRIACCIPNATDTQSQYVILTAFPVQQWLHKRASVLRYT